MVLDAVPDLVEKRGAGVSLDGFKHGVDATQDYRLEKVVGVQFWSLEDVFEPRRSGSKLVQNAARQVVNGRYREGSHFRALDVEVFVHGLVETGEPVNLDWILVSNVEAMLPKTLGLLSRELHGDGEIRAQLVHGGLVFDMS
jgi:hypothetical protein